MRSKRAARPLSLAPDPMATGTGRDLGMLCIDRCCRRTGISGLANWLLVTRSTHFFVVTDRDL